MQERAMKKKKEQEDSDLKECEIFKVKKRQQHC